MKISQCASNIQAAAGLRLIYDMPAVAAQNR